MEILESTKAASTTFGEEPLLVSPDGRVIDLAHGYVPLLTDFTFEDKAAKGLRKGKTEKDGEPPVFFSALELVRDHKALLLSGSSGSGKTTFAKHLCFRLATTGSIKTHPLIRNEIGIIHEDQWKYADIWPCYFAISGSETLKGWIDSTLYTLAEYFSTARHETVPNVLIVLDTIRLVNKLDTIDKAGDEGPALLIQILNSVKRLENVKLLLLGKTSVVTHWNIFSDVARHDMLPLLEIQRRQIASALTSISPAEVIIGTGAAAATPAYFALALEARHRGDQAEELLDAWLALVAPDKDASDEITAQAYEHLQKDGALQTKRNRSLKPVGGSSAVQHLLAAR